MTDGDRLHQEISDDEDVTTEREANQLVRRTGAQLHVLTVISQALAFKSQNQHRNLSKQ